MITTISAIGGLVGLVISISLLAWQTRAVARQTEISNRIAALSAINGATAGLREVHLLFVSDPGLLCSGTLPFWMPASLARSVRSGISLYPGQAGRAETGRTRLPHVARQLKRRFGAALGLALQWP